MELIERKYRDTPESSKKYPLRLTNYISYLADKGRLLEAKYFFDKLYDLKPDHIIAIKLGYRISIALFDNAGIDLFDKKLCQSRKNENEIVWFRFKFYYSVNDKNGSEECSEFLLSKKIKPEYLNAIIDAGINQKSQSIVINLMKYAKANNLKFSGSFESIAKKILLQKVVNHIVDTKNEQLLSTKTP